MAFVAFTQLASALPQPQPSAATDDECTPEIITYVVTMPAESASPTRLKVNHGDSSKKHGHHHYHAKSSSAAVVYPSFSIPKIDTSFAIASATASSKSAETPLAPYKFSTLLVPSSSSVAAAEATSTTDKPSPSSSAVKPSATYVVSNSNSGKNPFISNGIKAGLSGFVGIAKNFQEGFEALSVCCFFAHSDQCCGC